MYAPSNAISIKWHEYASLSVYVCASDRVCVIDHFFVHVLLSKFEENYSTHNRIAFMSTSCLRMCGFFFSKYE